MGGAKNYGYTVHSTIDTLPRGIVRTVLWYSSREINCVIRRCLDYRRATAEKRRLAMGLPPLEHRVLPGFPKFP